MARLKGRKTNGSVEVSGGLRKGVVKTMIRRLQKVLTIVWQSASSGLHPKSNPAPFCIGKEISRCEIILRVLHKLVYVVLLEAVNVCNVLYSCWTLLVFVGLLVLAGRL